MASYTPTFATSYLEACLENGWNPRTRLEGYSKLHLQPLAAPASHGTPSSPHTGLPSTSHTSSPSTSHPFSQSLSQPTSSSGTTSPAGFAAFKDNFELAHPKRLAPFITQTSPIFQEVIGGRATGEIEPEEEQGDRRVFGFTYTEEGKRRTVFQGALRTPPSSPALSDPSTAQVHPTPVEAVRKFRAPRFRLTQPRKPNDDQTNNSRCKACATYRYSRSIAALLAVMPNIPFMCGECEATKRGIDLEAFRFRM